MTTGVGVRNVNAAMINGSFDDSSNKYGNV